MRSSDSYVHHHVFVCQVGYFQWFGHGFQFHEVDGVGCRVVIGFHQPQRAARRNVLGQQEVHFIEPHPGKLCVCRDVVRVLVARFQHVLPRPIRVERDVLHVEVVRIERERTFRARSLGVVGQGEAYGQPPSGPVHVPFHIVALPHQLHRLLVGGFALQLPLVVGGLQEGAVRAATVRFRLIALVGAVVIASLHGIVRKGDGLRLQQLNTSGKQGRQHESYMFHNFSVLVC